MGMAARFGGLRLVLGGWVTGGVVVAAAHTRGAWCERTIGGPSSSTGGRRRRIRPPWTAGFVVVIVVASILSTPQPLGASAVCSPSGETDAVSWLKGQQRPDGGFGSQSDPLSATP